MKKFIGALLFLFFSFNLSAQTDYLEPVKDFSQSQGELGEYYRNVFSLLGKGFRAQPLARITVLPSFSPEYAMSVEIKNGRYYLISNTLSSTYWQADKSKVDVTTSSVQIGQPLYNSLCSLFRLVTTQVQDLDGYAGGLDGVVYYFSSTDPTGKVRMGRKWAPTKGIRMQRLIQICESAYLLSVKKDISESALTTEVSSLLKDLQIRAKNSPDEYKKPIYVGIYNTGVSELSTTGKYVDEPPVLLQAKPEVYAFNQMVYPAKYLANNTPGYVICEFTIDKEGRVLHPCILTSTHPEFAEEALRIVKGMPKWTPAKSKKELVDAKYTLYIPFRPQAYKERLAKEKK